jgi:hypothetical protein
MQWQEGPVVVPQGRDYAAASMRKSDIGMAPGTSSPAMCPGPELVERQPSRSGICQIWDFGIRGWENKSYKIMKAWTLTFKPNFYVEHTSGIVDIFRSVTIQE